MKSGDVFWFDYLWDHEARRGEQNGRKVRPVCVMFETNGWIYLFPITGAEPVTRPNAEPRRFERLPESEVERIGLGHRRDKDSHLVLDHYNKIRSDRLFDFRSPEAVGSLTPEFMRSVAGTFLRSVKEKRPMQGLTRV